MGILSRENLESIENPASLPSLKALRSPAFSNFSSRHPHKTKHSNNGATKEGREGYAARLAPKLTHSVAPEFTRPAPDRAERVLVGPAKKKLGSKLKKLKKSKSETYKIYSAHWLRPGPGLSQSTLQCLNGHHPAACHAP